MAHAMSSTSSARVARVARVALSRDARTPRATRKAFTAVRAHAHGETASTSTAAHGHGHGGSSDRRPGEKKGFVEEMRFVAMKLHTREQAPKEGEKKPEPKPEQQPVQRWEPTKEKYLKFLVESKVVYEAMEEIVASGASPQYEAFVNTGLERTEGLSKDIAWLEATHGLKAPVADGPGAEYAAFLKDLAERSPPEFICHFYNVYFAHSAGGKMIGRKVSEMILDGKELEFYKWDSAKGGLEGSLTAVKEKLNAAAERWSREEKDRCLEETGKSFQMSGALLRLIA
jgi:heme oxygenase